MAERGTPEYASVVECLVAMFEDVLQRDAIETIVDSCSGDLNLSVDAAMKITNNDSSTPQAHTENMPPEERVSNNSSATQNMVPVSYSIAMQSSNIVPAMPSQNSCSNYAASAHNSGPRKTQKKTYHVTWNDQLRRIVEHHTRGSRTLIFMRGAPGSGKTHLAERIVEIVIGGTEADFATHIYSTDDFYIFRGKYNYSRNNLSEAHTWNQNRARVAMSQGRSPLIIDNTNIKLWEMEFYARQGVLNGYILEIVEPNTPWSKKANQLAKKNIHNVPLTSIKMMLENYVDNVTGDYLLKYFNLTYPPDKTPPVLRSMPVYQISDVQNDPDASTTQLAMSDEAIKKAVLVNVGNVDMSLITKSVEDTELITDVSSTAIASSSAINIVKENPQSEREPVVLPIKENVKNQENEKKDLDVQKQLEEFEKVEQEWENGEHWDEGQETGNGNEQSLKGIGEASPKPPRASFKPYPEDNGTEEKCINNMVNDHDWRQAALFMPVWAGETVQSEEPEQPKVEVITSSTCMELGDFNYNNSKNYKIIATTSRDINKFHISNEREKIPNVRCLDKSTMTNDPVLTVASQRCKNEEKHFIAFRRLFSTASRSALRHIFDQCVGDVNWAVEIVMADMANNKLPPAEKGEVIEEEDDSSDSCDCLSFYNIVPNMTPENKPSPEQENIIALTNETASVAPKKINKREIKVSEASMQLKRQIEQNVTIGDGHYSDHCLKIRKWRRGECSTDEVQNDQPSTSEQPQKSAEDSQVGFAEELLEEVSGNSIFEEPNSDDEVATGFEEPPEKTVNIYVGKEFIVYLDALFGRSDMSYPDSLMPKISIPMSMLNQINALWIESLMHQLDEHEKQTAKMMQEDEEFSRALASKEQEIAASENKPAEVLDLKEIMDLELALSLYRKDVAEWKNKEPNDLAAKLTRDKLYNLFPEVAQDVLAELLMAHDNNFQTTVEVLLVSTGKTNILEEKNGVNKFVMQKELERQSQIVEAERKALSEVEWPLLPKGEVADMSVVNNYRTEADRHLQYRNTNILKANEHVRRGSIQVANYYRLVAEFHKLKYEQSNSLAAASLMQLHAAKNPDSTTIDLHYLRVGEALESLDLFIDTHIQKLKSLRGVHGPRRHTLYFITGRGLHSNGRPRIKPAVKKRLGQRGLTHGEVNPGLLSSQVTADNWLTHELA